MIGNMNILDNKNTLSIENTVTIRGIAILSIMFYNFIRHLIGIDGNEDYWSDVNVMTLLSGLKTYMSPLFAVSYWGWYGVPLFIFLSGYGLTKKYDKGDFNVMKYAYSHIKKIFLLMIPAFALYVILVDCFGNIKYPISLIIKQCTFTVNFLSLNIEPGIYWFFGLIIQLYLIFIVLRKLNSKWLWIILISFLIFDYSVLYLFTSCDMTYVRHNSIGWMPSFIFGIIYAKKQYNLLSPQQALITIPLFFVSSLIKLLYPLSPLFCIISVLSIVKFLKFKWLYYVGTISSAIFAMHAVVRQGLYSTYFEAWDLSVKIFIFTILTFVSAYIYNRLIKYLNRVH